MDLRRLDLREDQNQLERRLADAKTAEHVHGARKALKKLRAHTRLVRDTLPKGTFEKNDHAYRDAGRALSAARDSEVLVQTFDEVAKAAPPLPASARAALVHRRRESPGAPAASNARRAFAAAVQAPHVDLDDVDTWRKGIRRTYRDGRAALADASRDWHPDHAHALRKRVKDLRHELEALEFMAKPVLHPLRKVVHELGDVLGDDHDLAVLDAALRERGYRAWRKVLARKRAALRERALPLAAVVYAETPRRFVSRLLAYAKAR